jgi:SAM-dependent methyltransferase
MRSPRPLFDVVGNVWQWTETPIYPFEGFDVHPDLRRLYDAHFRRPPQPDQGRLVDFLRQRGRRASRYAFRRHFFQHAGFRYVVGQPLATASRMSITKATACSPSTPNSITATNTLACPTSPAHWRNSPSNAMGERPARSALDLGCATGRATFELAHHFDHVTGLDFSARFIGSAPSGRTGHAALHADRRRRTRVVPRRALADLGLATSAGKVEFIQGDACNLKPILTGYDLILAANLIDRLYSPRLPRKHA